MTKKNQIVISSCLIIFSFFTKAEAGTNKIDELKLVMNSSPLTLSQKIEHIGNRLGYGLSPIPFGIESSSKDPNQAPNTVLTIGEFAAKINSELSQPNPHTYSESMAVLVPGLRRPELYVNGCTSRTATYDHFSNTRAELAEANATDGMAMNVADLTSQMKRLRIMKMLIGSQKINQQKKLIDSQLNIRSILDEFWLNHFNIDLSKAGLQAAGNDGYEAKIHQKMYTTFYDLLSSVIKHPAMLVYLDNKANRITTNGFTASNQNLGRELLELHTLGKGPSIKGSPGFNPATDYSQVDVENASKILAGHNYSSPSYVFNNQNALKNVYTVRTLVNHKAVISYVSPDRKVMTLNIPDTVSDENRLSELLLYLVQNSSTKQNICRKLTKLFITNSKENEDNLEHVVNRCVAQWGTKGNLANMYHAIVSSREFWMVENFNNKIKNPVEIVISQYRAHGISIENFLNLSDNSIRGKNDNSCYGGSSLSYFQPSIYTISENILASIRENGLNIGNYVEPTGYNQEGESWLSLRYFSQVGRTSFRAANFQLIAGVPEQINIFDEKEIDKNLAIDNIRKDLGLSKTFEAVYKWREKPFVKPFQGQLINEYESKAEYRYLTRPLSPNGKVGTNPFMDLMTSQASILYK